MSQAAAPLCRPSLGKASMAGHGTSCQRRQWIRVLWSHDHHDPKQTAALGGGAGPRPRPGAAGLQGTTCPAVPVPLSHSAETRIQLHSRERQI